MALFQRIYDEWYELTGNTQFSVARMLFFLAAVSGVVVFPVSAYTNNTTADGFALMVVCSAVLISFAEIVLPMWSDSEIGWDPRIEDTKGDAYRKWPWYAARSTFGALAFIEFWLAVLCVPFHGPAAPHFCYALMWTALTCALFFCACNRQTVDPRAVV